MFACLKSLRIKSNILHIDLNSASNATYSHMHLLNQTKMNGEQIQFFDLIELHELFNLIEKHVELVLIELYALSRLIY